MKEAILTQTQIEDSFADLETARDRAFSSSDLETGVYTPEKQNVPRPSFEHFKLALQAYAETKALPNPMPESDRYSLSPEHHFMLGNFEGLRGLVKLNIDTAAGVKVIERPAIVLQGGQRVAVLLAEKPSQRISDMQHSLLETEYLKDAAEVSEQHSHADITNAGAIGPALVVVSSVGVHNAHYDVHQLAKGQRFGVNFSATGRQDFKVDGQTRSVRSRIFELRDSRLIMSSGKADELPADKLLFGVPVSASEQAIGATLAATASQHSQAPDLVKNFTQMVGE